MASCIVVGSYVDGLGVKPQLFLHAPPTEEPSMMFTPVVLTRKINKCAHAQTEGRCCPARKC